MVNKILSQDEINIYDFTYRNSEVLNNMLSDFEEIVWISRANGFKEGVIKTTNIRSLNLENRHLYTSFVSEVKSYMQEKSMAFVFPLENIFVKIIPDTYYIQQFLNPGLFDTISILYVVNNSHSGSQINFINKNLSIPLAKNNLLIFPSSEEYVYKLEGVQSGELIVGISYVEVENV